LAAEHGCKATSKNKRTGSELRHPRESGDPGGLGPRFRGDDVECCLNPKWFNYFWASPKCHGGSGAEPYDLQCD
jgi:hypothetical protein